MRTHVDLFSGIGGFALAARWTRVETIAFAEIDSYASRVLERQFPNIRNYGRVQDVPAIDNVWLVTGSLPCQPFSSASRGRKSGTADARWLWDEMLEVVQKCKPTWVLSENVTQFDGLALEKMVLDLEDHGYEIAPPLEIPACGVGLDHRRARNWICGYSDRDRKPELPVNAEVAGMPGNRSIAGSVGTTNGVSARMDRLRCLGNSIVPDIAYRFISRMVECDDLGRSEHADHETSNLRSLDVGA